MSNNISINFAKWVIHKFCDKNSFVDPNQFDFIITHLDNSVWDDFFANYNVDSNVDALIPQLIQKMPKKTRKNNLNSDNTKPKNSKKKVDAQTSTIHDSVIQGFTESVGRGKSAILRKDDVGVLYENDINNPLITDDVLPSNEPTEKNDNKKRTPKSKKINEVVIVNTEGVVEEITEEPKKKETKKRAPKAKKNQDDVVDQEPKEKKETKKRAPKAKKNQDAVVEDVVVEDTVVEDVVVEDVVVEDVVTEDAVAENIVDKEPIEKKETKKRAPKPKKNEEIVIVNTENVTEDVAENIVDKEPIEKKETKKRAPKPKNNIDVVVDEDALPVVEDNDKTDKKKRGHKKILDVNRPPDDVIIPIIEQEILSEESYLQKIDLDEEQVVLNEVFVNDVLFYVDSDDNWFDSNLQITDKLI